MKHTVEAIGDVVLGEVYGAITWVSMSEQLEDPREGTSELHDLMG